MRNNAQTQTETIGAPNTTKAFRAKTFPRNLGMVELENAVSKYRQAVRQHEQSSKSVEVTYGR